jgi:putative ATP-dependent endonuclease of the OLD family
MHIESITLTNFRCFGPDPTTVTLDTTLTALVGANGSGKTALLLALARLFGTSEQRHVRRQDFHVAADEDEPPVQRQLAIDVVMAFPELGNDDDDAAGSVPSFFEQMGADDNGVLKVRVRLDAEWTDDGSEEGAIEERLRTIQTFDEEFDEATECQVLQPMDRARIQMIYIPATRDGASQVTSFLRSRLWRAVSWGQVPLFV